MLKKVCVLALTAVLLSCRSPMVTTGSGIHDSISDIDESSFNRPSAFRVGVLLPLSGEASRYGQGLKKAALMALEDMNNPNLILQFYDTQSSPKAQEPPPKTLLTKKRR